MSIVAAASYKAYDATLDKLVSISIDKIRREICVSKEAALGFSKECWPYPHGALSTFELLLRERRVPYVIRSPEFVALYIYTIVVWEPAGVKIVEIYYDNRGFMRDPKGRLVDVSGMDVAAKERTATADIYMCLGHVAERADSVRIECIAPPYAGASAMWALERAKLCVSEKQDMDVLIDVVRRYEAELNSCKAELEELKKVKK